MFCLSFHNFEIPLWWTPDKVVMPPISRASQKAKSLVDARPVHDPRFRVDLT